MSAPWNTASAGVWRVASHGVNRRHRLVFKCAVAILVGAALGTIGMMIYAAQPWGDNYAYRSLGGYLTLLGLIGWALSPYIALIVLAHWLADSGKGLTVIVVAVALVALFGGWAMIDAIIVHPDAQGGLVFVFVALYQWLAVALVLFAGLWMKRRTSP